MSDMLEKYNKNENKTKNRSRETYQNFYNFYSFSSQMDQTYRCTEHVDSEDTFLSDTTNKTKQNKSHHCCSF